MVLHCHNTYTFIIWRDPEVPKINDDVYFGGS